MKILGIACSPRKRQTTYKAIEVSLEAAREFNPNLETPIVELAELDIRPCVACGSCRNGLSCQLDDDFEKLIPILADKTVAGMIIATPVYFGTMTAQCKAFIDRCAMFRRNGWIFRNRVGGVLAVGGFRNGGQEVTIQAVRAAMMCHDMVCVSDGKDTAHFGGTLFSNPENGVDDDTFGLKTAQNVGRRVAEVAAKMAAD
jgi:multimeric flavodoxin WrbA